MRLDFAGERVLAVVAHPDDAELSCAGTLARARADGASIGVCVMCLGDKGQPPRPIADLAAVRRRELLAAAALIGLEPAECGYPDGTLADGGEPRGKLIEVYRRFQPTLVLAHDAADYHPDHRAAGVLAEAASWLCTSRGHRSHSPALGRQPALWWMDTLGMIGWEPGFFIDVTDYLEVKEGMLQCHVSQIGAPGEGGRAGDTSFVSLPDLMRLQYRTRGAQAGVPAAEAFRLHLALKRSRAW